MNQQSSGQSSRPEVPQAREALDNMKYEIARELGINLKQGYNGDLTSRENGYVGGYMVKRLIKQAEQQMAGQQNNG
ncbi:MAG: alpha/beta-type small acid-soluble spore protein [Clostridia bacterium]|nr:alpha/beta-type small acid-soluble spore protein [Clostridia bacterium]